MSFEWALVKNGRALRFAPMVLQLIVSGHCDQFLTKAMFIGLYVVPLVNVGRNDIRGRWL